MKTANKIIDFLEHLLNRDIDARIKMSRDDTLKIIQADIKVLDAKVDNNFEVLCAKIGVLVAKVDNNFELLDAKIDNRFDVLDTKIVRLDDKIDSVASMKKWVVGIFVTILLAIAALVMPNVVALFG